MIDCPVCYRTIWANSTCHHGKCPPSANLDKLTIDATPYRLKGGVDNKGNRL